MLGQRQWSFSVERLRNIELVLTSTCLRRRSVAARQGLRRGRRLLAADEVGQDGAESPTAQEVDDEVDRRVGDDQQVTEALVVEERAGTDDPARVEDADEGLRHGGRRLGHDEDDDDDDQHPQDIRKLLVANAFLRVVFLDAFSLLVAFRQRPDSPQIVHFDPKIRQLPSN